MSENVQNKVEAAKTPESGQKSAEKREGLLVSVLCICILAAVIAIGAFLAVRSDKRGLSAPGITAASEGASAGSEAHGETAQVVTGEAATELAQVKNADAIHLITALSDKELGLEKDAFSFMVAQQAYVIEKESYVQVIAAEKIENEDGSFNIIPHGKFYISFDGKTILKEDMENPGTYEKIK